MGIFKYADGSEPAEDKQIKDADQPDVNSEKNVKDQADQGPGDILEGGESFQSTEAQSTFSSRTR